MASKTEIANRALSKLGEPRVSNIETDNTKAANTIRFMYDIVRDAVMQAFPWNFAIKRVGLAVDGTSPAWGFANRYQLPSDFLSLLAIKRNPVFRLEGQFILTDEGAPLDIRYIARITDTGDYDAMFVEALASRLAFEAAEEMTASNTKKQLLLQQMQLSISAAYASDSIQDAPQALETDEWLLSREDNKNDDINFNL